MEGNVGLTLIEERTKEGKLGRKELQTSWGSENISVTPVRIFHANIAHEGVPNEQKYSGLNATPLLPYSVMGWMLPRESTS